MSTSRLFANPAPCGDALTRTSSAAACHPARPTISFELFPPRHQHDDTAAWACVNRLMTAGPDFVSVTYQAGRSARDSRDTSVRMLMRANRLRPGLPAMAHLTCTSGTRGDLALIVRLLLHAGIRDFLALRGDGDTVELRRAVDLVRLIRQIAADELPAGVGTKTGGTGIDTCANPADYVSIAVAAYPCATGQRHRNDLAALAEKRRAGADFAISQVFYDAGDYARLVTDLAEDKTDLPVLAGIVPLTDLARLQAIRRLAGVDIPDHICAALSHPDPEERLRLGIGATMKLIRQTLRAGAPGIHLYTFNRTRPTLDIVEAVHAGGLAEAADSTAELMRLKLQRMPPSA